MLLNTQDTAFQKCSEVEIPESFYNRMTTGNLEVDLIFGTEYLAGLMKGVAITLTGTPGSGKSTATCQILEMLASQGRKVAIASGEESHHQIAYTCKRLGVENVDIAHIKDVEVIAEAMQHYDVIVVDSFQALRSNNPKLGKRASLQYAQDLLLGACKETGCVLIFILHITTAGLPKGGTDIIHAVDVNIKMTVDKHDKTVRLIDVYKNRFGETKVHSAIMTSKGFDFKGVVEQTDEESKDPKKPINSERKSKILDIKEPPHITLDRVCDSLGVSGQTATILLRELVGEKKIQKYGRGANAIWKLAMDCKNVYDACKAMK
jgi:predicted ATP-dependent serine protease